MINITRNQPNIIKGHDGNKQRNQKKQNPPIPEIIFFYKPEDEIGRNENKIIPTGFSGDRNSFCRIENGTAHSPAINCDPNIPEVIGYDREQGRNQSDDDYAFLYTQFFSP